MAKVYSEKTRAEAIERVRRGGSYREVSEAMGGRPSYAIIRLWCEGYVPTGKRRESAVLTAPQKVEAVRRVQGGEPYAEVAAEVGCSGPTLLNWRRMYEAGGEGALVTSYDRVRP